MKKTACVTALLIAMALSTEVKAGGPPPVCMVVDKIVLEPDEKAPTRIQVWGTFIFCKDNATYDRPVSGYLYYTAAKGKEDACRKEWAKLQKLVADKHIVAWGSCGVPKVNGHLREATENPKSPLLFPSWSRSVSCAAVSALDPLSSWETTSTVLKVSRNTARTE